MTFTSEEEWLRHETGCPRVSLWRRVLRWLRGDGRGM